MADVGVAEVKDGHDEIETPARGRNGADVSGDKQGGGYGTPQDCSAWPEGDPSERL